MDHLLKEELDLIKDQNDEIIESLSLIKEKLGIKDDLDDLDDLDLTDDEEEAETDNKKLDF